VDTEAEAAVIGRVGRLIAEDQGGQSLSLDDLDPVEWELMLLWRQRAEANERVCLGSVAQLNATVQAVVESFGKKS
jgi:hypothetical protein